jgi:hypothetical protein
MAERRHEARHLRKLACAALAFQAWLDDGADPVDAGTPAQEARRQLRALSRPGPQPVTTHTYDSLGRLTGTTDAPASAGYSLSLGDAGELLVATRAGIFAFDLDARGTLHFIARRPATVTPEEGGPS